MAFSIVFALMAISLTESSNFQPQPRIVNGIPIKANEYPWMTSLVLWKYDAQYDDFFPAYTCGASLIETSPPIFMTAAHCVETLYENTTDGTLILDDVASLVSLDINRTYPQDTVDGDVYERVVISRFNQIHIHPQWNFSEASSTLDGYDIALLIADANVTLNITIDPLPSLVKHEYRGEPCCEMEEKLNIIGYGRNATDGVGTYSLEFATVEYLDPVECTILFYNLLNYTLADAGETIESLHEAVAEDDDAHIWFCTSDNQTGVCQGDSGGPIFRTVEGELEIVGVTSFTYQGCGNGNPSGFTNVGHFSDWIEKTIEFEVNGVTWSPTPDPTAPTAAPVVPPTPRPIMGNGSQGNVFVYSFLISTLMLSMNL